MPRKCSQSTKKKISLANSRKIAFNCFTCEKEVYRKPSAVKGSKKNFCSKKCYNIHQTEKTPSEHPNWKGGSYLAHRRYVAKNPELIAHLKSRRYAREKGAEGSHSLYEWESLKKRHNFKCIGCNKKKKLTKDHIIPISKGGSDYIDNIQPLCRNCNSKKHNKIV